MSPTIRIDDDVYRVLQSRAEPFVDTPNTVLRRLLELGDAAEKREELAGASQVRVDSVEPFVPEKGAARKKRTKKRKRAPSGTLLREEAYEIPLLSVLDEAGGSAAASEVIKALGLQLDGRLMPNDYESLNSGAIRWENRAQFVRLKLVQAGDMAGDSRRGVWEISQQGRRRVLADSSS